MILHSICTPLICVNVRRERERPPMQCTYIYIPSPLWCASAQSRLGLEVHYVRGRTLVSALFVVVLVTLFLLKTSSLLVCTFLY